MEATITTNISKSNQLKNALTSEKLTEDNIKEERAISWLNNEKVCFLVKTKINVEGVWIDVGSTEIEEFKNSVESLKILKSNVPEPFLTAVLAIWETSTDTKNLTEMEVPDDDQRKSQSE